MRRLYAAFDLHASNNYLAVSDERGKRLLSRKLPNDPTRILAALGPHRKKIAGIAVESTYNWYWLVDMLMEKGYQKYGVKSLFLHLFVRGRCYPGKNPACFLVSFQTRVEFFAVYARRRIVEAARQLPDLRLCQAAISLQHLHDQSALNCHRSPRKQTLL